MTCQCWHQLLFLIPISFRWTWLLSPDARQLGRDLIQQLLMATKQLLSRLTRSLHGLKHVFLVVQDTLTRCFINSWLTVDDHETAAKERKKKANRNHSHCICVLSSCCQTSKLPSLRPSSRACDSTHRWIRVWRDYAMEGRCTWTYSRRLQLVVLLLLRVIDIITTRSNFLQRVDFCIFFLQRVIGIVQLQRVARAINNAL